MSTHDYLLFRPDEHASEASDSATRHSIGAGLLAMDFSLDPGALFASSGTPSMTDLSATGAKPPQPELHRLAGDTFKNSASNFFLGGGGGGGEGASQLGLGLGFLDGSSVFDHSGLDAFLAFPGASSVVLSDFGPSALAPQPGQPTTAPFSLERGFAHDPYFDLFLDHTSSIQQQLHLAGSGGPVFSSFAAGALRPSPPSSASPPTSLSSLGRPSPAASSPPTVANSTTAAAASDSALHAELVSFLASPPQPRNDPVHDQKLLELERSLANFSSSLASPLQQVALPILPPLPEAVTADGRQLQHRHQQQLQQRSFSFFLSSVAAGTPAATLSSPPQATPTVYASPAETQPAGDARNTSSPVHPYQTFAVSPQAGAAGLVGSRTEQSQQRAAGVPSTGRTGPWPQRQQSAPSAASQRKPPAITTSIVSSSQQPRPAPPVAPAMLQSQQPLQPAPQAPHQQQLPTGATTPLALDAPLLQLRRHTLPHPLQPSTTEILLRLAADDDHTSPGFDFASHLHHAALGGQLPAPGAQATRNPFHLHIPGSASVVSPLPSPASGASSVFTGASSAASSAFPATASSPGGSSTASSPTPTPEAAAAAAAAGGARGRRSTWTAGGGGGGPMSLAPAQGRRSGPSPPMMCPVEGCGRTFNKGLNLRSHIKTHAAERVYACGVCGGTFRRSHDLRRHEASLHTPGGERAFPCGRCPKSFSRLDALKRHVSRPRSRCFIDLADGGMQQLQAILRARGLNVD